MDQDDGVELETSSTEFEDNKPGSVKANVNPHEESTEAKSHYHYRRQRTTTALYLLEIWSWRCWKKINRTNIKSGEYSIQSVGMSIIKPVKIHM